MLSQRPQDRWTGSVPDSDAAHMRPLAAKRVNAAWWRVIWSGALLVIFALNVTSRLEDAQKSDATTGFLVITLVVLVRFGYYLWRLITAKREFKQLG